MRRIITSLAMIFFLVGFNQTIAQVTASYSGMFNVGALYGNNKTKFQVQTIHGVSYRGWFAGLGGGIDDYFQQSIPVFVDIRKSIFDKYNTPFIYVDGGANIVTKGREESWQKSRMSSGVFYEAGAGYKAGLNSRLVLNIAAGYSAKTYEDNIYNKKSIPTPPYITDEWVLTNNDKYSLQRFVMKVGLQF